LRQKTIDDEVTPSHNDPNKSEPKKQDDPYFYDVPAALQDTMDDQ